MRERYYNFEEGEGGRGGVFNLLTGALAVVFV